MQPATNEEETEAATRRELISTNVPSLEGSAPSYHCSHMPVEDRNHADSEPVTYVHAGPFAAADRSADVPDAVTTLPASQLPPPQEPLSFGSIPLPPPIRYEDIPGGDIDRWERTMRIQLLRTAAEVYPYQRDNIMAIIQYYENGGLLPGHGTVIVYALRGVVKHGSLADLAEDMEALATEIPYIEMGGCQRSTSVAMHGQSPPLSTPTAYPVNPVDQATSPGLDNLLPIR